ncbi:MAG: hypothetical protein QXT63_04275, partial [Thermoplasmata archaeon]
ALEYAKQAGEEAEKVKTDFLKATDAIQIAKSKIFEIEKMGVSSNKATELYKLAMEAMDRADYEKVNTLCAECIKDAELSQLEFVKKVIESTEQILLNAQSMGADVSTAQAIFNKAKDAVAKKA